MGYEVVYHYHDRLPNGKWDMENTQEMKKKVGNPIDEVELGKLAAIILGQLAKRDKLVVDVDVYEYTKKKINYKECVDGNGIILKNKKFSTNSTELVEEITEDFTEETNPPAITSNKPKPSLSQSETVEMWMVFDPEIHNLHEAKKKGLRFTVNKKYPVFSMRTNVSGTQILTILNDDGQKQEVDEKFFVANTGIRLIGDTDNQWSDPQGSRKNEPKLSHSGNYDADIPVLRPNYRAI